MWERQHDGISLWSGARIGALRLLSVVALSVVAVLAACVAPPPLLIAPSPEPTALPPWPQELAGTSWSLQYMFVNGVQRPASWRYQTIEFDSDLRYIANDGCTEFYCDEPDATGAYECLTIKACTVEDRASGEAGPLPLDEAFQSAIARHVQSAVSKGLLFLQTSDGTVLVFRPSPRLITHPRPEFSVDMEKFKEAGCSTETRYGDGYSCPTGPLHLLGCDTVYTYDLLGALTPTAPLICESDYPPTALWQHYQRWGGCMYPTPYLSYVISTGDSFQLIKPKDVPALQTQFAPVESADEALGYALAGTYLYANYDVELDSSVEYLTDEIENTHVEKVSDGYVVHLFSGLTPLCGCGDHIVYAVDVLVTTTGEIEQRVTGPVYRLEACID
jgi:hypothetical protein